MTIIQQSARVLYNRPVSTDAFVLGLLCRGYEKARPGQFAMLQIPGEAAPLLRRPFSIHGHVRNQNGDRGIEILYKVVGPGTRLLSQAQSGTVVDLVGPLGNSFRLPPPGATVYLVGGGVGVPPLAFLARTLKEEGHDLRRCRMFLGGRSKQDLLCLECFSDVGIPVTVTTDDGSAGDQCLVTNPVTVAVEKTRPDILYACGPLPMLSCLVGIAREHGLHCQVSIEAMMACGIGACLGCAVEKANDPDNYWHVCKDGPVFDADQVAI